MSLSDNLRRLARERIPIGAGGSARSYHFYNAYQRFNSNQKGGSSRQSVFRTLFGQGSFL